MNTQHQNFYHNAIYGSGYDVLRLQIPVVNGRNSRVFIADTSRAGRLVFRFDSRNIALRNQGISSLLVAHGMCVPNVKVHQYNNCLYEVYPYLSGTTFQECLNFGMSTSQILDTYEKIAYQIKKMSDIPVQKFASIENSDCSSVAQSNIIAKTGNRAQGYIVKHGTDLLNLGPKTVCHCDLTPCNVILTDDDKPVSILDLNAVSVANINFCVAISGLSLIRNKLNPAMFYDACNDIMPGQINRMRLAVTEKICALYFRGYCK